MLSQISLLNLKISVSVAFFLGFMPYTWNDKQRVIQKVNSNFHDTRYYMAMLAFLFQGSFSATRVLYVILFEENLSQHYISVVMAIVFIALSLIALFNLLAIDEMNYFTNACIVFQRRFAKKYYLNPKMNITWKMDILILFTTAGQFIMPIIVGVFYYETQEAVIYCPTIIPPQYRPFPITLIYGLLIMYGACGIVAFFNSVFLIAIINSYCLLKIFMEARYGAKKYITKNCTREPLEMTILIRSCRILNTAYENGYRTFLMPAQSLVTRSIFSCNLLLIRLFSKLKLTERVTFISIAIIFLIAWLIILHYGAKFFKYSNQCKNSWKKYSSENVTTKRYMKKLLLSWKPLQIRIGDVSTMKPNSTIQYMLVISRGTMKLLLGRSLTILAGQ